MPSFIDRWRTDELRGLFAVTVEESLLERKLDDYRLVKLIGIGGMANVYRAIDTRTGEDVAVKVINATFRSRPEFLTRFEREANALAKLAHPHIVKFRHYGQVDDLLYIAMEYVNGIDLAALIDGYQADKEFMGLDDVHRLLSELGSALDYAHTQGVIHRDVKPHNIMLDRDGRAILSDFGLVLVTDIGTLGNVFGSAHYISPEQVISSANAIPQSDIYSLAVVLFEMLTCEVPFEAENSTAIAEMHVSEPVPSLLKYRPEMPMVVDEVIGKALAKSVADRYQSGAELAEAFGRAIANAPAHMTTSKIIPKQRVTSALNIKSLEDHDLVADKFLSSKIILAIAIVCIVIIFLVQISLDVF